jgi:hypothetical protein
MLYISSLGESQGGLFIGSVRGTVTMFKRPPNCPIYTKYAFMRALQSFCTLNYFTHDLLHDDTCLFLLGLCPMHCSDLQPRRCQCFHPQVACSTRACVSMNTLGMRLREHPRPPSRVPLLSSCQKIIKYESWFVSRCLWRLSRLMALRGASDAGPLARIPSSSTKLNAHGDAEGGFGVRAPACIPNMNINV